MSDNVIPFRSRAESEVLADETHRSTAELEARLVDSIAQQVTGAAFDLGLDSRFIAILGRHITDFKIGMLPNDSEQRSYLTVRSRPESSEYERVAAINPKQIGMYQEWLYRAATETCPDEGFEPDKDACFKTALEWVLFELSADAAGNSCYMQQHYDKYIPDYNGQSPYYSAERTVSRSFIQQYAQDLDEGDVVYDHESFRSGFALQLLVDALLRNGVSTSIKHGQWTVHHIFGNYPQPLKAEGSMPINPLDYHEIVQRFQSIHPIDGLRGRMAELALSFELNIDD